MKMEVVEFYPGSYCPKTSCLQGTIHIFLPDLQLDLRGIFVKRTKKDKWIFLVPHRIDYDRKEKKEVKYPVYDFLKPEMKTAFFDELKKNGVAYILKYMDENAHELSEIYQERKKKAIERKEKYKAMKAKKGKKYVSRGDSKVSKPFPGYSPTGGSYSTKSTYPTTQRPYAPSPYAVSKKPTTQDRQRGSMPADNSDEEGRGNVK